MLTGSWSLKNVSLQWISTSKWCLNVITMSKKSLTQVFKSSGAKSFHRVVLEYTPAIKRWGCWFKKGTEKRGGIRFRRIGQFKTGLQLEPFLNPLQFTVSYEVLSNPFQVATPYRQGRKHGVIVSPWLNHTACMIGAFPFLSPVHIVVLSTRWIISGSFLTGSPLRNLWCCAKLTELLVWRNEKKRDFHTSGPLPNAVLQGWMGFQEWEDCWIQASIFLVINWILMSERKALF